jgi:hypothetical protein
MFAVGAAMKIGDGTTATALALPKVGLACSMFTVSGHCLGHKTPQHGIALQAKGTGTVNRVRLG